MSSRFPTLLLALLAVACQSAPGPGEPLVPPQGFAAELAPFRGEALEGPRALPEPQAAPSQETGEEPAEEPERAPEDARMADCAAWLLPELPADVGEDLAATFAGAREGGELAFAYPLLAVGGRVLRGDEAEAWIAELGTRLRASRALAERVVLPPGTTAKLSLAALEPLRLPSRAPTDTGAPSPDLVRRRAALLVSHPAGGGALELALQVVDVGQHADSSLAERDSFGAPPGEAEEEAPPPDPRAPREELLAGLARVAAGEGPVVLLLPLPFVTGEARAVAWKVEALAPADVDPGALARGLERTHAELEQSPPTGRARPAEPDERREQLFTELLAGLAPGADARYGLLRLATVGGAPLAEDLALVAEDDALAAFSGAVRDARDRALQSGGVADLGLLLERTAYDWLAGQLDDDGLDAMLHGLLLRHAGAAGSYPATLQELLEQADDRAALDALLAEENRLLLEDASPSARVRAYDWLAARDRAPEGYDPLADEEARRAALARIEEREREALRAAWADEAALEEEAP